MFFVAELEGVALTKYVDSAHVQTISAGVTQSDIKDLKKWDWRKKLTLKEALTYHERALYKYREAVKKAVKVPETKNQLDALTSITYNIGVSGMRHSAFIKKINARESAAEIKASFLKWTKVKGKTIKGLVSRRRKEMDLYFNGDYGDGKITVFPVNPKTHKPMYAKGTIVDISQLA